MRERPILMHARSIIGILEGRKTQTRRIIKNPPSALAELKSEHAKNICVVDGGIRCDWYAGVFSIPLRCPYGQPGDRLWVRETWREPGSCQMPDSSIPSFMTRSDVIYKADDESCDGPWRPSIFMPRRFSRLTLEVTNIRVERVQDISIVDCIAEGIMIPHGEPMYADEPLERYSEKHAFNKLWDDTNGKGAWDRNDWVWVVEFKKS